MFIEIQVFVEMDTKKFLSLMFRVYVVIIIAVAICDSKYCIKDVSLTESYVSVCLIFSLYLMKRF